MGREVASDLRLLQCRPARLRPALADDSAASDAIQLLGRRGIRRREIGNPVDERFLGKGVRACADGGVAFRIRMPDGSFRIRRNGRLPKRLGVDGKSKPIAGVEFDSHCRGHPAIVSDTDIFAYINSPVNDFKNAASNS